MGRNLVLPAKTKFDVTCELSLANVLNSLCVPAFTA